MTVLVTGGAGYIGSHMVLALRDRGEKVVVVDNLSTGFPWALPPDVPLRGGDVGDAAFMEGVIREFDVTAIAHFAAKIVVPESVAHPLMYYANNTVKSRALIETAIRCGIRQFIFSSTAAVSGDASGEPLSEEQAALPVSPYGRSKLITEWMLEDAARAHDFRYVAIRYFNVAGADPQGRSGQSTPAATHLIKVAVQTALGQRGHLDVFGTDYPTRDGSCLRDYIHVSDLADAHVDALRYLRDGGHSLVVNCGYGKGFSVLEVIDTVKKVTGIDFDTRMVGRRPGDPASVVARADRIRSVLGWSPKIDDLATLVRQAHAGEKTRRARNI